MRLPAAAERGTRTVDSTPGRFGTIELSQLSQFNARARGGKGVIVLMLSVVVVVVVAALAVRRGDVARLLRGGGRRRW